MIFLILINAVDSLGVFLDKLIGCYLFLSFNDIRDGELFISIDLAHEGVRKSYIVNLDKIIKKS